MSTELLKPKDRKLYFSSQVNQSSISKLTKDILDIEEDDKYLIGYYKLHGLDYVPQPIKIYIDSYGGSVYQAFGLLGVIDKCSTPIHTIVTGCAMSCGFMILISGHKRFAYPRSTALYHQATGWAKDTTEDIAQYHEELERVQADIEELTLEKTKITKKRLSQVRREKLDWYIPANECLELGIIDEIL